MKRGGIMCEGIVRKSELVVWTGMSQIECCAICREGFQVGVDICRVLDCTHIFHAKCIDMWFVKASSCPLCKNDLRNNSSQRSLGRSSQTSSNMSLGSASLRSGQILVGHSNSDPALLRAHPELRSPTPDRHVNSTPSLPPDRSMEVLSFSRSERSIALLSESSSGLLPAVQEGSEEARLEESRHSSNPNSARSRESALSGSRCPPEIPESHSAASTARGIAEEDEKMEDLDAKPTWRLLLTESPEAPVFGQPVQQRVALPAHTTAWSLTLPRHRKLREERQVFSPPVPVMKVTHGSQSVPQGPPPVGAMKRSLSQSPEADGSGAGEDRLASSTKGVVVYSTRPIVAPRPRQAQPPYFRTMPGAGYRPPVVAFHPARLGARFAFCFAEVNKTEWVIF
ncbi:unnamed protein product [Effrenium voratum]|nr:unnamed protein product [Effrenium voratum]